MISMRKVQSDANSPERAPTQGLPEALRAQRDRIIDNALAELGSNPFVVAAEHEKQAKADQLRQAASTFSNALIRPDAAPAASQSASEQTKTAPAQPVAPAAPPAEKAVAAHFDNPEDADRATRTLEAQALIEAAFQKGGQA